MTRLANKIALVTGASAAWAAPRRWRSPPPARVMVHYGRNAEKQRRWSIRSAPWAEGPTRSPPTRRAGRRPHARSSQVRNLTGGRLDILVSNAGISKAAPIEEMTVEDFDNLFAVNVRAPYFLVQQLLPMLGKGGNIVFLSSLGARTAVGALSAYASTKGAINTLVNL